MRSRHGSILVEKLAVRRQELLDALGAGVTSWDLYNRMVGQLMGLSDALLLSDETDDDLNRG